jgi:hypothetical protein
MLEGEIARIIHLASDNVETTFAVAAVDEQPNFHGLLPLLFTTTDDLLYPLFFDIFGLFKSSNQEKRCNSTTAVLGRYQCRLG